MKLASQCKTKLSLNKPCCNHVFETAAQVLTSPWYLLIFLPSYFLFFLRGPLKNSQCSMESSQLGFSLQSHLYVVHGSGVRWEERCGNTTHGNNTFYHQDSMLSSWLQPTLWPGIPSAQSECNRQEAAAPNSVHLELSSQEPSPNGSQYQVTRCL